MNFMKLILNVSGAEYAPFCKKGMPGPDRRKAAVAAGNGCAVFYSGRDGLSVLGFWRLLVAEDFHFPHESETVLLEILVAGGRPCETEGFIYLFVE